MKFDKQALDDQARVADFRKELAQLPPIPWNTGVDEHLFLCQQQVAALLTWFFSPPVRKKRSRMISEEAWTLIQFKKSCLCFLRCDRNARRLGSLQSSFLAWRNKCGLSDEFFCFGVKELSS